MKRLLLLFMHLPVLGANWYADNASTGANNGTNWANAWTNVTAVVWGVSGVTAGDTLYISGGSTSKTYTNRWIIGASGVSNSPITIRPGQDAGHNGVVIFDGSAYGTNTTTNFLSFSTQDYIVINGEFAGQRHFLFQNLINYSDKDSAQAIRASPTIGSAIYYCTITNVNIGIHFQTITNVTVAFNDVSVMGDCAIRLWGTGAAAPYWDSNLVFSNHITLMYLAGGPDGIQGRLFGVSIFKNTFGLDNIATRPSGQHPDYIQAAGGSQAPRYLKIMQNEFVNIADSAIDIDPFSDTGSIEDIEIYNNIFRITALFDVFPNYIRMYNTAAGAPYVVFYNNVQVLNNIFVDNTNENTSVVSFSTEVGDNPGTNNIVGNNTFVNCGSSTSFLWRLLKSNGAQSQWSITNNILYNATPSSAIVQYLGTNYTANQWKASFDPSTGTNIPTFISYTFQSPNNNYNLSGSDTNAIDRGLNYNAIFANDFNGNPRGSLWDIGPYEYVGTALNTVTARAGRIVKSQ